MGTGAGHPKLIFVGEPFAGRLYELTLEKTTVGRGPHNTLSIHDPSISLAHCEILVHGPEVIVHDLASGNGTFLDGARINGQCQVKNGQVIRFGSVQARLELPPQNWEETATDETAIFVMQRAERDQRREKNRPKPADISMTLESPAELGHQTVLLPRHAAPKLPSEGGTPNPEPRTPKKFLARLLWWKK